MRVLVAPKKELIFTAVASQIASLVRKKPDCVIGLPAGSTPTGLYPELVKRFERGKIDFSKTAFLGLDEFVGFGHKNPKSNARFLRSRFLDHVNASEENIFLMDGAATDAKAEGKRFESLVKEKGLDLVLLGIGENGRIAYNEPGSDFATRPRVVSIAAYSQKMLSVQFSASKIPRQAITLGLSTLMTGKQVILMAFGSKKNAAIRSMVHVPPSVSCPASVLQRHSNCSVYCDEEAADGMRTVFPIEYNNNRFFFERNLPEGKRIVFISPHPDDSAIAAGGSLWMLSKKNIVEVWVMVTGYRAVLTGKTPEEKARIRENEMTQESKILGTKPSFLRLGFYENGEKNFVADREKMEQLLKKAKPDIIFLPHEADSHPTHAFSRRLTIEALAKTGLECELWEFESPWALFSHGKFNSIVEFSKEAFDRKIQSVNRHESQNERTRFDEIAKSITRFRAVTIPEQILSDYGDKPPKIMDFVELFNVRSRVLIKKTG